MLHSHSHASHTAEEIQLQPEPRGGRTTACVVDDEVLFISWLSKRFIFGVCYCSCYLHAVLIFRLLVFPLFLSSPHGACLPVLYFSSASPSSFGFCFQHSQRNAHTQAFAVVTFTNHCRIHNVPLLANAKERMVSIALGQRKRAPRCSAQQKGGQLAGCL